MTHSYSRRLFLRGLGGAAVAAPFLSSVAQRVAKGQDMPSDTPRRLIVMFTHYGCMTNRWFPENSHGPLREADLAGTSLEVLAPHVSKLLMPRGIRAMNEWTTAANLGQGNDPNLQVVGSYFTCVPVSPHTSDPFDLSTVTKYNAMPTAPSLDHVCARSVSPGGQPLLLRVSGTNDTPSSAISYSAGEEIFPGVGNPNQIFNALTGLFDTDEMSPDTYKVLRGKSVIDLVRDDLETLERLDMSRSDRQKLEAWKQLLHETNGALLSANCNSMVASALSLSTETLAAYDAAVGEAGTDRVTTKIVGDLDGADLFSNLAVLSTLCDHSRVIVLKYPANYVYRGLDITIDSHSLANRTGSAMLGGTCVPNANDMIMTIDRYYTAKFAHLIGQLDSFDEGDRTLLDNTATVWFQEFSDGAAFNLNNMPILQAGSCGGYFKTGQAVNVDDGSSTLSRGNSEFACAIDGRTSGTDLKATGTPAELGNAPINKYFCNLMNAIGVRGGADGFPAVDGAGPVTHYGMYDDTADFASGGENPPRISSPGEFEALKSS